LQFRTKLWLTVRNIDRLQFGVECSLSQLIDPADVIEGMPRSHSCQNYAVGRLIAWMTRILGNLVGAEHKYYIHIPIIIVPNWLLGGRLSLDFTLRPGSTERPFGFPQLVNKFGTGARWCQNYDCEGTGEEIKR
jgi:hypothetical protein